MDRSQKERVVASLNQIFADSALVVVTRHQGLTVAEATELRRQMGEAGATYRVTKNRFARIALEGTACVGIADMFSGPTSIAFSGDPVAAAKASVAYAQKNDKLVVVGGALGETILDADGVKALARLPSLDELRGKIVGLVQAPAARMARVLAAPAGALARVLKGYASKGEAA